MNRAIGIIITVVWLLCMGLLIRRDVLPYWLADDPPSAPIPQAEFQVGMYSEDGRLIGTTWVTTLTLPGQQSVLSLTELDLKALSRVLPLAGDLYLETDLTYGEDRKLDEFSFRIETALLSAHIDGARYEQEYACTARVGETVTQLSLDGRLAQYLSDSIRPFTHLSNLRVGQRWRLRTLDPLSLLKGQSVEFTTILVEVTGRESIEHAGRRVECFRIEAAGAVAWADESGRVLRQEVRIPLVGKCRMIDQPFERQRYRKARQEAKFLREARSERSRAARVPASEN